ncbi:MAG: L,D-transpeptidase family protein [Sulfuricurvum sp.]|uniref:L,D-transpeptidase family protein n=1 Tax=Sulfuricurvum sp. TaxID=2025608 RepID=UPI00261C9EC1|nr:L,D-transpeptidase family protein [Sulfuricurvum sp.]MDD5160346.1 L,D-transpeptidase family protein [Sulfuricurvum sp.]
MVKPTVFFIILIGSLLSADILTLYKSGGKKLMEQQMNIPSYWTGALVNKDIRFGYFERAFSLLTCNKEKGALELYIPDRQQRFSLKKRYGAFTGKNPGDKLSEGDLRTPVGIYTLTEKKKNVDPFYGPMAFVTSYPNLYDRIRGKNGDGIWVHGVPISGTRDPFTHGCIAINNNDLVQLDQTINPSNTLLIIDSSLKQWTNPAAYSAILAALYQWKYTWSYNDIEGYLSYYDPAFKRFDGMNYEQFKRYKERVFAKNEAKSITFHDLNIIPYPGEKRNLFWVTFNQNYVSESYQYKGEKSLLIRLNNDQSISILTEE